MKSNIYSAGPWRAHLGVSLAVVPGSHLIKTGYGAETPIALVPKGGGTHGVELQKGNALLMQVAPEAIELLQRARLALRFRTPQSAEAKDLVRLIDELIDRTGRPKPWRLE